MRREFLIGVALFFILSGFLITLLLLEERDRSGTIDLRRFYLRRAWQGHSVRTVSLRIASSPHSAAACYVPLPGDVARHKSIALVAISV